MFRYPSGEPAVLTKKQIESLNKIRERWGLPDSFHVHPAFGDCVMVNVGSMWLGVEADGYTHS